MRPIKSPSISFIDRLKTFQGYWDDCETTARQLAAIGHVYDRPPLEAFEEGSRCASCSAFVKRERSLRVFGGPFGVLSNEEEVGDSDVTFEGLNFHDPGCIQLQIRVPLDFQVGNAGGADGSRRSVADVRNLWERRSSRSAAPRSGSVVSQSSSLFSLPTELRLEIYALVLPKLEKDTTIVPLNRESGRIVTSVGHEKIGPRDLSRTNLLQTCRAVHEEALDLLFNTITYKFELTKTLYLFLRHIGQHGRQLLKSVDVMCGFREDAVAFALLASCHNLKILTLRMARPRLMTPEAPLWIAEGVACLLDISGLETLRFGACGKAPYMDDRKADASIVRRELTRPKGTAGRLKWVQGRPDV